jgi:hypothetical protein
MQYHHADATRRDFDRRVKANHRSCSSIFEEALIGRIWCSCIKQARAWMSHKCEQGQLHHSRSINLKREGSLSWSSLRRVIVAKTRLRRCSRVASCLGLLQDDSPRIFTTSNTSAAIRAVTSASSPNLRPNGCQWISQGQLRP